MSPNESEEIIVRKDQSFIRAIYNRDIGNAAIVNFSSVPKGKGIGTELFDEFVGKCKEYPGVRTISFTTINPIVLKITEKYNPQFHVGERQLTRGETVGRIKEEKAVCGEIVLGKQMRLYRGVPCGWDRKIRRGDIWTRDEKEAASYGEFTDIDFEDRNVGYTIAIDIPMEGLRPEKPREEPGRWFTFSDLRKIKRMGVLPALDAYCRILLPESASEDEKEEYGWICSHLKRFPMDYQMEELWYRFPKEKFPSPFGPLVAYCDVFVPENEYCREVLQSQQLQEHKREEADDTLESIISDVQLLAEDRACFKAITTKGSKVFVEVPESDFEELRKGVYGIVEVPVKGYSDERIGVWHELEGGAVLRFYNYSNIRPAERIKIPKMPPDNPPDKTVYHPKLF